MVNEIFLIMWELLRLTITDKVLWTVLPLILATIAMISYFAKYEKERLGWNTYVANSLVLLFVSMILLRHIYDLNIYGFGNYLEYMWKTVSVILLLGIGYVIFKGNFNHIFPERIAGYLNSPVTINLIAYVIILYVHTTREESLSLFLALFLILLVLLTVLELARVILLRIFKMLKRMKNKDKIDNVKQEKFEIDELKKELAEKQRGLQEFQTKDLEKQKREAIKLKKVARGQRLRDIKKSRRKKRR